MTIHNNSWPRGRAGAHRKSAARLSECHSHSELLHDWGNREQKEGPPAASGYCVSASQESERGPGHSVGTEEGMARTTAGFHVCHPNSERGGLDSKPTPFLWAPRICFLKHGCVRHGDLYGLQTDSFHPAPLLSSEQSHCCQPPGSVPHPLRVHPCQVPISLSLISSNCTSEWGLQALLQEKSALGSGVTSEHPQDCLWTT